MTQDITNSALEEQFNENESHENTKDTEINSQPINFSELSLKEIIQNFQDLLDKGDQHEMYRHADSIKAAFYKTLKKEKIAAGMIIPATESGVMGGEEDDQEYVVSSNPFAELERGFKELYNRYKTERSAFLQQLEKQKEENLRLKNEIIEDLKTLLDNQEDIQDTFPSFRELQNRWRMVGPVPQSSNKDLWETYQFLVEKFYDYVKINNELRDLDLKKNLELKTELCEKAEQLIEESNVVQAFRRLQKYHEEWRELGPVPKEVREEIWNRFKEATSKVNKRQQEYFETLKEDQKRNLELKTEICIKAEAIVSVEDSEKDWNTLSKMIEALQAEWRGIGFASKRDNQKIYDRFRAACDKFYNAKREFYADFKKVMHDNLEKKIQLCEQAEALKDSEEWKKTTDHLIALQKKWKEIGPVARKHSDIVWKRFRAACDHFFNNKAKHFSNVEENYDDNLKRKLELIEEILEFKPDNNSAENMEALKDFQQRWNEIGFVPLKEKERVQAAYRHAVDLKFSDVKSSENENKLIRFRKHLKELQSSSRGDRGVKAERDKLFQKFRQLEQDIALWENNKGFFAKSEKADSIIYDIDKKISKAKDELVQIEEKIKLIDKQYE